MMRKPVTTVISQLRLLVDGKVQGTFFRAYVKEKAILHGLVGTVKNLSDGRVEIIAQGEKAALTHFLHDCENESPAATVTKVFVEWSEVSLSFKKFEVVY